MRKYILTALVGASTFGLYHYLPEMSQSHHYKRLAKLSLDGGGACSGYFVTDTMILTAGHCTKDVTSVVVDSALDKTLSRHEAKVLVENNEYDFSVITIGEDTLKDFPIDKLETRIERGMVGTIVATNGMDAVGDYDFMQFTIQGIADIMFKNRLVGKNYDDAQQGSSGGALISQDGKILGVVSVGGNGNMGFTDPRDIRRELEKILGK